MAQEKAESLMKQNGYIAKALVGTLIVLAAGCTNAPDIDGIATTASPKIIAEIDNTGWGATRVSGTSFESDDEIGVNIGSNANLKYTYGDDNTFSIAENNGKTFYYDNMYEKVTAYYPYSSTGGTLTKAEDYLFASSSTSIYSGGDTPTEVTLKFHHVMAKLSVSFGSSITSASDVSDLKLSGVKPNGTFNTETGEAVATGDVADIDISSGVEILLFPQMLFDNKVTISFTYDGKKYSASITNLNNSLIGGKRYSYTVNITSGE
jgi:hypothetical protein